MDVGTWLARLGLSRYEQAFRDDDVDDEVLSRLTAQDLTDSVACSSSPTSEPTG